MKKLVLFVAIVAAVTFSACSNKTQEAAPAEPTTVEATQDVTPAQEVAPVDTTATDTTVAK